MVLINSVLCFSCVNRFTRNTGTSWSWWLTRPTRPSWNSFCCSWIPYNSAQPDQGYTAMSTGNSKNIWWILSSICARKWESTWPGFGWEFVCSVFKGNEVVAAFSNVLVLWRYESLRDSFNEGCILRSAASKGCMFSFRMKECKPKLRS